VPLDRLDKLAVECVGEEKTTERVATLISTMGVHFTSKILGVDVDLFLNDVTSDLDVVGSLDELDTGQSALGDEAGAVTGPGAPGDGLAFDITNDRIGLRRTPEAEILD
jgi:hypothetical protein